MADSEELVKPLSGHRFVGVQIDDQEAGQDCLSCNKCTYGYKPHSWRKKCLSCKCPRESHEVSSVQGARTRLGLVTDQDHQAHISSQYAWIPPGLTGEQIELYFKNIPKEDVPRIGSSGEVLRKQKLFRQIPRQDLALSACSHVEAQHTTSYQDFITARNEIALDVGVARMIGGRASCEGCGDAIGVGRPGVAAPRLGPVLFHPGCFRCAACQELLADLAYCVHDGRIFCERHYAEQLKPRCAGCDESVKPPQSKQSRCGGGGAQEWRFHGPVMGLVVSVPVAFVGGVELLACIAHIKLVLAAPQEAMAGYHSSSSPSPVTVIENVAAPKSVFEGGRRRSSSLGDLLDGQGALQGLPSGRSKSVGQPQAGQPTTCSLEVTAVRRAKSPRSRAEALKRQMDVDVQSLGLQKRHQLVVVVGDEFTPGLRRLRSRSPARSEEMLRKAQEIAAQVAVALESVQKPDHDGWKVCQEEQLQLKAEDFEAVQPQKLFKEPSSTPPKQGKAEGKSTQERIDHETRSKKQKLLEEDLDAPDVVKQQKLFIEPSSTTPKQGKAEVKSTQERIDHETRSKKQKLREEDFDVSDVAKEQNLFKEPSSTTPKQGKAEGKSSQELIDHEQQKILEETSSTTSKQGKLPQVRKATEQQNLLEHSTSTTLKLEKTKVPPSQESIDRKAVPQQHNVDVSDTENQLKLLKKISSTTSKQGKAEEKSSQELIDHEQQGMFEKTAPMSLKHENVEETRSQELIDHEKVGPNEKRKPAEETSRSEALKMLKNEDSEDLMPFEAPKRETAAENLQPEENGNEPIEMDTERRKSASEGAFWKIFDLKNVAFLVVFLLVLNNSKLFTFRP